MENSGIESIEELEWNDSTIIANWKIANATATRNLSVLINNIAIKGVDRDKK